MANEELNPIEKFHKNVSKTNSKIPALLNILVQPGNPDSLVAGGRISRLEEKCYRACTPALPALLHQAVCKSFVELKVEFSGTKRETHIFYCLPKHTYIWIQGFSFLLENTTPWNRTLESDRPNIKSRHNFLMIVLLWTSLS